MSESPFFYLTVEQIDELHDLALEEHGGRPGVVDTASLARVSRIPYEVWQRDQGDIWAQAAAYAQSIIQNRPYHDGNRRTALVCALVFLEVNGYERHAFNEDNLVEAITWLAKSELDRDNFAQYLRDAYDGTTGTWGAA